MAKETQSLPDDDAALQEKAANLIDHCGPFTDKARPYPVQRLQVELLIGLGWNKARRRSLHGLGHSMSISKIILVSLPKRPRIGRRHLLHIVPKRAKLTSNIVCRHSCFDANEARRQIRKSRPDASARDLLSQDDGAACGEPAHVKCILAHIDADGGGH